MRRHFFTAFLLVLFSVRIGVQAAHAGEIVPVHANKQDTVTDSVATRKTIFSIINTVVSASSSFDIDKVANFYTPNALVADEEPPFSWNGPTAGAQWINTVEKTCKDLKIKKLHGKIGRISVYMQDGESVYVIVPAVYSGEIKDEPFEEEGAFTFGFRLVSGKWMIKSQVWVTRRGM